MKNTGNELMIGDVFITETGRIVYDRISIHSNRMTSTVLHNSKTYLSTKVIALLISHIKDTNVFSDFASLIVTPDVVGWIRTTQSEYPK